MRQLLAVILASTFLTAGPVVFDHQTAQAQSLFEALFPRAAERRRKRVELRRKRERQLRAQQRLASGGGTRIKAPSFKTYVPVSLAPVKLERLADSFEADQQKLLAERTAPVENPQSAGPQTIAEVIAEADAETATSVVAPSSPVSQVSTVPAVTQPTPVIVENVAVQDSETLPNADEQELAVAVATGVEPTLIIQPLEAEIVDMAPEPVRLSAGFGHLGSIELKARKDLGKALIAHYQNDPQFIWIDASGKINERANSVLQVLADAESFGLRSEDYAMPLMTVGDDATEDDLLQASMEFEFALSASALRYMADARNGVVNPNKISGYHDFGELSSDYLELLQKVSADADAAAMMLSQHPGEKAFDLLRSELETARANAIGYESIEIAAKTFLRPGQTSDQLENIVESIRRKAPASLLADHFDVFALHHYDGLYSDEVVAMIRDFQKSQKLKPDGIIGRNTISKMQAADPKVRVNKVLLAMERLRWHPDKLGNTHVFVNQPAYRASYMRDGKAQLSMRAIVGKPANQTSFFYDKIEYVEYNPYWGVPRSILVNEMLPKLINNPGYLDNLGYEVTNQRGRAISSSSVDWWNVGSNFPYNVRQPPGSRNALGELKIMFPNKHSIYMHDTPAKSLFRRSSRAFSHGCVRLADPRGMAAAVLGTNVNQVASKLAGGKNKQQKLAQHIPVYVAYFTAWPDDDGTVQFYGDVYGRDKALGKAMKMEADKRQQARDS